MDRSGPHDANEDRRQSRGSDIRREKKTLARVYTLIKEREEAAEAEAK